jgi:MFS family permease
MNRIVPEPPFWILPVIVLSQFLCTSLWFAGNAVMPDLMSSFRLAGSAMGHITSAVQLGFITGTLCYSFLGIADRFSPSLVFFLSSLAASAFSLSLVVGGPGIAAVVAFRFMTGFFLAGVYPVGMKIASDYYHKGLGKALGFLVGALVIGTAFPHALKGLTVALSWKTVLVVTSLLSLLGGLLVMVCIPDGPYRKPGSRFKPEEVFGLFRNSSFRSASLGYFGHMWELYAFWAFVPVILSTYMQMHPGIYLDIPLLSFCIIACGSLSCILGGYVSVKAGCRKTAFVFLLVSGTCCIVSPLAFCLPPPLMIAFLIIWGLAVIGDSPLFSTLVALHAPPQAKGTALTTVTCTGFAITVVSIQLLTALQQRLDNQYLYLFLAIGPLWGLLLMRGAGERASSSSLS